MVYFACPRRIGDQEELIGDTSYACEHTHISQRVEIGRYVSIANLCTIGAQQHPISNLTTHPLNLPEYDRKQTTIGHDVWIGCNSVIMSGVTIGTGAIVGAGS